MGVSNVPRLILLPEKRRGTESVSVPCHSGYAGMRSVAEGLF
jgi:hypothetical protein